AAGITGPVSVKLPPAAPTRVPGGSLTLGCAVTNASTQTCTWQIQEGANGGPVNGSGLFPATTTPGTYHLKATSQADSTKSDTATITVMTLDPGVWVNVTPGAIDLNQSSFTNDNFGMQDILVDPVNPTDLYAFTCHQAVWKSTELGLAGGRPNHPGPGCRQGHRR